MINHPKPEEWVPFLYGETKPALRRELKAHLQGCTECQQELRRWKLSLHRLDQWELPRTRARLELFVPFLKWAAAAAIVLGLGFGLGRVTAHRVDLETVRAQVEPEMRREFAEMLHREVDKSAAATLTQAQRQAEGVGAAYYALLKKDLDTVAINTDVGLRQTQERLLQVADYSQPAGRQQKLQ
jgi:hypothetical protein